MKEVKKVETPTIRYKTGIIVFDVLIGIAFVVLMICFISFIALLGRKDPSALASILILPAMAISGGLTGAFGVVQTIISAMSLKKGTSHKALPIISMVIAIIFVTLVMAVLIVAFIRNANKDALL
ncbi:MAG: hypothetical protein MJ206_00450 [Bacilli bacterium]|nr:hypothetical protein [Bacilli bacterium]